MNTDSGHRASIDLITTDLDDPEALTSLLATHILRPARSLYLMPSPRDDETDELSQGRRDDFGDGRYLMIRMEESIDESTAKFDPFLRGFVLLTNLFPHVFSGGPLARTLELPAETYFARSHPIAYLLWADLACLVGGLLHRDGPARPKNRGIRGDYEPLPNDLALEELRAIQRLLLLATASPTDEGERYQRINRGLRPVGREVATEIDGILHRSARQRLVWFADEELGYERTPDGDYLEVSAGWFDRGVFPTVIPETISAVFALDFIETLALDPQTGICALCNRPVLLNPVQVSRVRDGKPVYHADCHEEHRRRYVRTWQRSNYVRKGAIS